jgi:hypothetical protein
VLCDFRNAVSRIDAARSKPRQPRSLADKGCIGARDRSHFIFSGRLAFRAAWYISLRASWPCSVSDLSDRGVRITGVLALAIPDEFVLCVLDGRARQCRVRWRLAFALGAEFTDCVTKEAGQLEHMLEAAE